VHLNNWIDDGSKKVKDRRPRGRLIYGS